MPADDRPVSRRLSRSWLVAAAVVLLAAAAVLAIRHRRASQLPSSFADQCLAFAHAECDWNDRCLGRARSGIVAFGYGADHASCLEQWTHRCARGHWCDPAAVAKTGKDVPVEVSPAEAAAATRAIAHASCASRSALPGPGVCEPTPADGKLRSY